MPATTRSSTPSPPDGARARLQAFAPPTDDWGVVGSDTPSDGLGTAAPTPARSVRTVDFSQPTKFSSDQQRRIARALESFCQTATARLSAELRTPLEFELESSSQLSWLMAQRKLSGTALSALLEVSPAETRMLLVGDLAFVLTGVECLLGGAPERTPTERRLSDIDWVLIRRLFDSIVAQLSGAWQDLGKLQLSVGEIEQQSEAIQIASVSEPTLMFRIITRFGAHAGSLMLLVPWMAIESVADQLGGNDTRAVHDDVDSAAALQHVLSGASVTLRAEVTGATLSVEEVLALRPGSIVEFGVAAQEGVSVYIEDRLVARARPGQHSGRRAVRIETKDVKRRRLR